MTATSKSKANLRGKREGESDIKQNKEKAKAAGHKVRRYKGNGNVKQGIADSSPLKRLGRQKTRGRNCVSARVASYNYLRCKQRT
jgi:hypothetical protein